MLTTILFAVANLDGMEKIVIKKLSCVHLTHAVKMESVRTKKMDSSANATLDLEVYIYIIIFLGFTALISFQTVLKAVIRQLSNNHFLHSP